MDNWSQVSVRGLGRPVRHASVAWRAAHQHLGSERARFQTILAIFRDFRRFLPSDTKVWRSSLKKVRLLRKRDQESSAAPQ